MIRSLKGTFAPNLWHEQKYSNEWAFHLIGWTKMLSHVLPKYVISYIGKLGLHLGMMANPLCLVLLFS